MRITFKDHSYTVYKQTYQCNLRVCKNAERPSINTRIPIVNIAQNPKTIYSLIDPTKLGVVKPICKIMFHNTSDNSTRAKQILNYKE